MCQFYLLLLVRTRSMSVQKQVKKPGPTMVKCVTPWPCTGGGATLGEVVECPGTTSDNHPCKRLLQIRAGTNAEKPSFGKFFLIHPEDEGGCGYFSYITFTEGENEIQLQEPVYRRAKRRIATSNIPDEDIEPARKRIQVESILNPGVEERLKSLETTITLMKGEVADLYTSFKGIMEFFEERKKNEKPS